MTVASGLRAARVRALFDARYRHCLEARQEGLRNPYSAEKFADELARLTLESDAFLDEPAFANVLEALPDDDAGAQAAARVLGFLVWIRDNWRDGIRTTSPEEAFQSSRAWRALPPGEYPLRAPQGEALERHFMFRHLDAALAHAGAIPGPAREILEGAHRELIRAVAWPRVHAWAAALEVPPAQRGTTDRAAAWRGHLIAELDHRIPPALTPALGRYVALAELLTRAGVANVDRVLARSVVVAAGRKGRLPAK